MKRFVLVILCTVLFSTACATSHLSKASPRNDPILRELNRANCTYAALYVDNNYKWTVTLYVLPLNNRLGSVTSAGKHVFCISEFHIKNTNHLSIRIRSHNQPRQSGTKTILDQLRKGDVWKLFIPSVSLEGWGYILLPYGVVEEGLKR